MAFENVIYYISGMGHNVITGNRILLILCLAIIPGLAQSQKDDKGLPSRKVTFVMPFEFDFDFGASNGNAVIGRIFPAGKRKLSVAPHFYYNITKPDGAPNGLFRVDILYPLPGS